MAELDFNAIWAKQQQVKVEKDRNKKASAKTTNKVAKGKKFKHRKEMLRHTGLVQCLDRTPLDGTRMTQLQTPRHLEDIYNETDMKISIIDLQEQCIIENPYKLIVIDDPVFSYDFRVNEEFKKIQFLVRTPTSLFASMHGAKSEDNRYELVFYKSRAALELFNLPFRE